MTRVRNILAMILALALTPGPWACSSTAEEGDDAGASDGALDAGAASLVVHLPGLTDWTCPRGWAPRKLSAGKAAAFNACEPPAHEDCPAGQIQVLGESACRRLGSACPQGPFLDQAAIRKLAPEHKGKIWYVAPGAAGGDGGQSKPLGTIDQAMAKAKDGDIVALARGQHTGALLVMKSLAFVGACVESTTLFAPASGGGPEVMLLLGPGPTRLANMRISGDREGVRVGNKHRLSLSGVELAELMGAGLTFTSDSVGELSELVVRDTRSRADKSGGLAIKATQGAKITLTRSVLVNNRDAALWTLIPIEGGRAPEVTLEDVVIRDTKSLELDGSGGMGAIFFNEVQLTVRRALLLENRDVGLMLTYNKPSKAPAKIHIEDLIVRKTQPADKSGKFGVGIAVTGCDLTARRLVIEENHGAGIFIHQMPGVPVSTASFTDLVIQATRSQPADKLRGEGMLSLAQELTVSRALIRGNRVFGLVASPRDPQGIDYPAVALSDLVVVGTLAGESNDEGGQGLALIHAKARLERVLLQENLTLGLYAGLNGTLDAEDLMIHDTRSQVSNGRSGVGMQLVDGIKASITRARISSSQEAGLLCGTAETSRPPSVSLREVAVEGTRAAACVGYPAATACEEGGVTYGGGSAVVILDKTTATLERFVFQGSAVAGVQVGAGGSVTLTDGEIHDNAIGANIQVPGYDMDTVLNDSVRYYNNDTNLQSEALPLPEAAPPPTVSF